MLSDGCRDRLYNYKFDQAVSRLDDNATVAERMLVEALATTFGNPGWFGGHMNIVISAALKSVGVTED